MKSSLESKILLAVIVLSFIVRLYKIDNPIADWHSWRQADTAAVARNFYKEGYNPLLPKYDDMSGVAENPVVNPGRYRFVEFPIYESLVYFSYLLNGGVDEKLARLVTVFISLGSLVFIYLITKRHFGSKIALLSSFLFGLLPYSVYYSRVILPDPLLVLFSLGMFYFVDLWISNGRRRDVMFALFFSVGAFLTKPVAIFYLLPLFYVLYRKEGSFWPTKLKHWGCLAISLLPFLLWRIWMQQHPEGIPASNWLFNGTHIRFRPAYWRWIIGNRLGGEILGVGGFSLFLIGFLKKPSIKQNYLLHFLAFSSFLYLIVFATGNVQHDYYQILIIPALVIFAARGVVLLFDGLEGFLPRIVTIPLAILFLTLSVYLPWNEVKELYKINNPAIVQAGQEANKILPKNAIVVAPYDHDTAFLYQTNRSGFPAIDLPLPVLIKSYNVSYMVSVDNSDVTKKAERDYTVIDQKPDFVIIDLTKPRVEKL